jgi:hypothetical protein
VDLSQPCSHPGIRVAKRPTTLAAFSAQLTQPFSGGVVAPAGLAFGIQQSEVGEAFQVARRGVFFDLRRPVTVAETVDAAETFKYAAIRKLAGDSNFQSQVRGDRGITWAGVQSKLADYLSEAIGQDREERIPWIRHQGLVRHALNEILGESGWRSETREAKTGRPRPVQWIIATPQAKPGEANLPALPADWPPDDELGPPPDATGLRRAEDRGSYAGTFGPPGGLHVSPGSMFTFDNQAACAS